jgi:hypothetical protein
LDLSGRDDTSDFFGFRAHRGARRVGSGFMEDRGRKCAEDARSADGHDADFRDATVTMASDPATGGTASVHSYDAAYLELVQRRGLPLATLDAELINAAIAEGVVLLGQ